MSMTSSRTLVVSSLTVLALVVAACGQVPDAQDPNTSSAPVRQPGAGLIVRDFGTAQDDYGQGLAANATGVYAVGRTNGSLDGPNKGNFDAFVRKYDGGVVWAQQFGTRGFDRAVAVAADAAGNSYVAGDTNGALGFKIGNSDGFLRKFGPTGTVAWTRQFGTVSSDVAYDVALDGTGNAFVLSRDNNTGFTVRKFGPTGTLLTSRTISSLPSLYPHSLAVDSQGDVVVLVGWNGGAIQNQNVRLFKLTNALADVWNIPYQSNSDDYAYDVAASGTDIYFTMEFDTPTAGYGAQLVKLSTTGAVLWHRQLEPTTICNCTILNSVTADSSGVYVAGNTNGAFVGFTDAAGISDVVVFRYDAVGARLWTRQLGTSTFDIASSVAASDAVYVTGSTNGNLLGDPKYGTNDPDAYLLQLDKATGAVLGIDQ